MIIYSRTALAQDTDGNLTRLTTVGPEQNELQVQETNLSEYIEEIIDQLKITNFQLSTLTENFIDEMGE